MDIKQNVNEYLKYRVPEARPTSFDYCYNYFQSFYENNCVEKISSEENMYMSCLQIGFFLASWGMLRGSSFLLNRSVKHYEDLINLISETEDEIWEIDVDSYTKENIDRILKYGSKIQRILGGIDNNVTATLTTKIMLGVFGNVIAIDTNNRNAFSIRGFKRKTFQELRSFYENHKTKIDSIKISTLNFHDSNKTKRHYPKIKIIDMIGWVEGQKN